MVITQSSQVGEEEPGNTIEALREEIGDHPYEYYIKFQKKKKEEFYGKKIAQ